MNIEPNPRGLELMVQVQVPTDGRFPRGRMEERCRREAMTLREDAQRLAKVNVVAFASLLIGFLLTFLPAMDMLQGK